MGQATVKATRRELRRAMGVGALDHVQAQDQAVGILQNGLAGCQREIAAIAVNHAEFKKATRLEFVDAYKARAHDHDLEQRRVNGFLLRPFLGRLRWLLTGK